MGYWGKHPMAGDYPSDKAYEVYKFLRPDAFGPGVDCYSDEWTADMKRRMEECDKSALVAVGADLSEMAFVVPFMVAHLEVRIPMGPERDALKEMIGDGGAEERGYEQCRSGSGRDKYGRFENPGDYADELRDKWDGLMDGTIAFDSLGPNYGLIDEITIQNAEGTPGLVNKR